jgi:ElaB/YqjD/DUF883 family membrane-anchored ribosome-binding protein
MVAEPHNPNVKHDAPYDSGEGGSVGVQTSDRIRSEIDCAREQLDQTIDELTYRLTPEQIIQRTIASCQRSARSTTGKMAHLVREHPLPAAVIGAGIVWMVKSCLASKSEGRSGLYPMSVAPPRSRMTRIRDRVSDTASHAVEGVKHVGASAAHAVTAAGAGIKHAAEYTGSTVKHAAQSTGSGVGHLASATGSRVQHGAREAVHQTERFVNDYPLAAAGVCFALGLAGGLAVPRTRKEDQLLGEKRDQLIEQARNAGADLLRKGQQAVERAGESVVAAVEQKTRGMTGNDNDDMAT